MGGPTACPSVDDRLETVQQAGQLVALLLQLRVQLLHLALIHCRLFVKTRAGGGALGESSARARPREPRPLVRSWRRQRDLDGVFGRRLGRGSLGPFILRLAHVGRVCLQGALRPWRHFSALL